jgi:hypothetical protein
MVCADRISLQNPAGAARVNSEADHLRRSKTASNFAIARGRSHNKYFKFADRSGFAKLILAIILMLWLAMPKPTDMSSTFIMPCSLRKWGSSVGGNISSPAAASDIGALEVTTVQMFYSRVYLAHRRISDPGLDMLRMPTALSRQRLNRDALLSAAAIHLLKRFHNPAMRVSLQLPISIALRRPGSSVIKHITSGCVLNVTFNYCALPR